MEVNPSQKMQEQLELYPYWTGTVVQLIKEFAQKYPNSAALKFNNSTLSFAQLEQKSDELALYLIENGIEFEEKIVTIFQPSFELIISIYAILKAGGVYVPLNPKDGNERLRFIIDDLECSKILGTKKNLLKVAGLTNSTLIEISEQGPKPLFLSEKAKKNFHGVQTITPNNLAFIIYTSGTTGRPKGVMVEHRNLFSFIQIMRKTIDVSYGDRWLQNPNIHFDLAVGTIFLSLCNGATL
ncbi:MAG: hypothetical protein E2O68_08590, partial [Deltaproteobacteria bacterium]